MPEKTEKLDNQNTTSILCKDCIGLSEASIYCNTYNIRLRVWCNVDKHPVKCQECYDKSVICNK